MIYLLEDNNFDRLAWKGMELSDINELFDFLKDPDYRVRTLAAQAIQMKFATKDTFNRVLRMINSNNIINREIGAYILGQLGTPKMPFAQDSLAELYKLLDNNEEDDVLVSAISSIGHILSYRQDLLPIPNNFIDKIIFFSKVSNPDIRIATAMTLASIGNITKVQEAIKKLLNDENQKVQEWAEVANEILSD